MITCFECFLTITTPLPSHHFFTHSPLLHHFPSSTLSHHLHPLLPPSTETMHKLFSLLVSWLCFYISKSRSKNEIKSFQTFVLRASLFILHLSISISSFIHPPLVHSFILHFFIRSSSTCSFIHSCSIHLVSTPVSIHLTKDDLFVSNCSREAVVHFTNAPINNNETLNQRR